MCYVVNATHYRYAQYEYIFLWKKTASILKTGPINLTSNGECSFSYIHSICIFLFKVDIHALSKKIPRFQ
jgi:hypothetical protein